MKTELTTLDKVKKVLGMPLELAQMKLDDGVTIIEAEVFEAGQNVSIVTEDGQLIPLPVSNEEQPYILEDGMELVVKEEGVIYEIREPMKTGEEAQQPSTPMSEEEQVATSETPTETPVAKKVVESVSKETYFTKELHDSMVSEIAELKAQIEELKQPKEEVELSEEVVEPIKHNPENKKEVELFKISPNRKANSTIDRVRNTIFNK